MVMWVVAWNNTGLWQISYGKIFDAWVFQSAEKCVDHYILPTCDLTYFQQQHWKRLHWSIIDIDFSSKR